MKLLVALALAVRVSSSPTDGPGSTIQLPREKPDPEPEVPDCAPEDFEDCSQFSKTCKVFDKNPGPNQCKVKYEADYTEDDCSVSVIDVGQTGGVFVQWCSEKPLEKECNCQKGKGKKCIVRKGSNGKILTRNQEQPVCKDPKAEDVVFNCPSYEFLLDFFVNQD